MLLVGNNRLAAFDPIMLTLGGRGRNSVDSLHFVHPQNLDQVPEGHGG